jgi:hypothetical protein
MASGDLKRGVQSARHAEAGERWVCMSFAMPQLARLRLAVALGCLSACHTPRGLALVPTSAQQVHIIASGEFDLAVPVTFKRSDSVACERQTYNFTPDGPCAPRIEIAFAAVSGSVKCGPKHFEIETDMLAGKSWRWATAKIDGPKCGRRLWRRAPFINGEITLLASPEDMEVLRALVAAAHWTSSIEPLVEFAHEEEKSQWVFNEQSCE